MARKTKKGKRPWLLIGGAAIILLVLILLLRQPVDPVRIDPWDPVIGEADAPITVVMFHDYGCGQCRKFFEETYPDFNDEWVATGKARLVIKHFPVISGSSGMIAAQASLCAADQGRFEDFHNALVTTGPESTDEPLPTASADKVAEAVGLDMERFYTCLDDETHKAEVEATQRQGETELGIDTTPILYVNGLKIVGVPTYETLESVLRKFRT